MQLSDGRHIGLDADGYLLNLKDWRREVAEALANAENIDLTAEHWELLEAARDFYDQFEHSPATRALIKFIKMNLGDTKGRSIYLLRLFPNSPALLISKIAGLPRPDNCL